MIVRTEIYKYNPRQCSPEELRETFVAREEILADVLGVLRERRSAEANQHFLITGSRGAWVMISGASSVMIACSPTAMERPVVRSLRIMWVKNVMFSSSTVGLPS